MGDVRLIRCRRVFSLFRPRQSPVPEHVEESVAELAADCELRLLLADAYRINQVDDAGLYGLAEYAANLAMEHCVHVMIIHQLKQHTRNL